jgi:phosphatidyl-N-methylethanolamine N-methyltransferase
MTLVALFVAGVLLSLERACYVGIAQAPQAFRRWCARPWVATLGEPIVVVQKLFYVFKLLQASVFLGWCYVHGNGPWVPALHSHLALAGAGLAIVIGQLLVWSVFLRLGRAGVFYGDRLGYDVPWCDSFPFSVLSHPQYVGTVLTIWGVFLVLRYPGADWYLLPILQTVYYLAGAWLEGTSTAKRSDASGPRSARIIRACSGRRAASPAGWHAAWLWSDVITGAARKRRPTGGERAPTLSHDLGQ